MGCECCKTDAPQDYARCKLAKGKPHGHYTAPCGMDFGSNYTPPKKKRKKRK